MKNILFILTLLLFSCQSYKETKTYSYCIVDSVVVIPVGKESTLQFDQIWEAKCDDMTFRSRRPIRVGDTMKFYYIIVEEK